MNCKQNMTDTKAITAMDPSYGMKAVSNCGGFVFALLE